MRVRKLRVLLLPLLKNMRGGLQYPTRLLAVDIVLVRQALRGAATDILVTETSFHLVQYAFAQRAVG